MSNTRSNPLSARIGAGSLTLVQGDITSESVQAIVTAANSGLRGGGGVDGAVHRAAGPELLEACRELGGCPTGDAVATPAFGLRQAERVIHAVGPIYGRNEGRDEELLASAHRRSLEVAAAEGCRSIAFPAISCGVYGFPIARAAQIALVVIRDALLAGQVEEVRYVLFADAEFQVFAQALRDLANESEVVQLAS
ncbi:MAG TPA: O-acetyl-ADP-ribose deacetylase [Planctomycetes bacterium]|nr:O-acetyl-ADP-ribose deacetylase [Planctomycetota bacterium]